MGSISVDKAAKPPFPMAVVLCGHFLRTARNTGGIVQEATEHVLCGHFSFHPEPGVTTSDWSGSSVQDNKERISSSRGAGNKDDNKGEGSAQPYFPTRGNH